MDESNYKDIIRNLNISKRHGQNFLINREIAKSEANFGMDRIVIEIGPGLGILTKQLAKVAKKVIAIEWDNSLYAILKDQMNAENVELINSDFFKVPKKGLSGADIMIANIPYNLSSKVIMWLGQERLPAVLCIQKEFAEHMASKPGEKSYSKLSVMSALQFSVTYVMDVSRNEFYPVPRVDSAIIYLRPKGLKIDERTTKMISMLMIHKKKKLRNAFIDSARLLELEKDEAGAIADQIPGKDRRIFQMQPEEILETAKYLKKKIVK